MLFACILPVGGDGALNTVVLWELHSAPVDEAGAGHPGPAGGADGEGRDRHAVC